MKFQKGQAPWNKGKNISEETRNKIKKKLKKAWKEKDWSGRNKKISKILKGRTFSEEHKRKIRENHKGMLGKKVSDKTKIKMSKAKKGKKCFWYGKKMTLGQREILSKTHLGYKQSEEQIIKRNISCLKFFKLKEPTSIEKKVYNELKARHLLFETQKLINGRFLVDAYIPSLNLIIEADGDYWHSLPNIMKKDKAENAYLTKCGYNLLRLSEKEINDDSFKERMVN